MTNTKLQKIILFSIIFLSGFFVFQTNQAQAYTPPIGIPDPGMWGTTHPIDSTAPDVAVKCPTWPAGQTNNCYYIDNTHPQATDTGNLYGYPDKPRLTPHGGNAFTTFTAGAYIEMHGGPYPLREGTMTYFYLQGTSEQPVWFRGDLELMPIITGSIELRDSAYAFIENLEFNGGAGSCINIVSINNTTNHVVVRNSKFKNRLDTGSTSAVGTNLADGRTMNNVVVYNNEFTELGNWQNEEDLDFHGFGVTVWSGDSTSELYNVWFLNNYGYHISGNLIQVTGGQFPWAIKSTHHIYIGKNEGHSLRQTPIAVKKAQDVIISQNTSYDMDVFGSQNGDCFGFQYSPARIWWLYNTGHDCNNGIRQAAAGVTNQDGTTLNWTLGQNYGSGGDAPYIVKHNGHIYMCIKNTIPAIADNEPGVGSHWTDYWVQAPSDDLSYTYENTDAYIIGNLFYDIYPRVGVPSWYVGKEIGLGFYKNNGHIYLSYKWHMAALDNEPGVGVNQATYWTSSTGDSSSADDPELVFGEKVRDPGNDYFRNGVAFAMRSGSGHRYLVNNTAYNIYDGILTAQQAASLNMANNIISEIHGPSGSLNSYHINLLTANNQEYYTNLDHELYYDSEEGHKIIWNTVMYLNPGSFYSAIGKGQHNLGSNPLFNNVLTKDFTLQSNSLAITSGEADPYGVYAKFEELYGLNIRVDHRGVNRSIGAMTLGAFEASEYVPDTTAPSSPTNLSVL
jgi:hypothetical protein